MGDQSVPVVSVGNDADGIRARRPPHPDLVGWTFTCLLCDTVELLRSDDYLNNLKAQGASMNRSQCYLTVPVRCELCAKEKYTWQTRKDLQKKLGKRAKGYRPSLHTYTLGQAIYAEPNNADSLYYSLHKEMKTAFRKFIRSKWWRTRVDGCFYTIEVKRSNMDDGTVKLHPHVHAIVLHDDVHDFKEAAQERGLGEYTYVRRVKGSLEKPINYILKYALKGHGDPMYRGRYYETTGVFRQNREVR